MGRRSHTNVEFRAAGSTPEDRLSSGLRCAVRKWPWPKGEKERRPSFPAWPSRHYRLPCPPCHQRLEESRSPSSFQDRDGHRLVAARAGYLFWRGPPQSRDRKSPEPCQEQLSKRMRPMSPPPSRSNL